MDKPSMTIRPSIEQSHGIKPRPTSPRPPTPPSQFVRGELMIKKLEDIIFQDEHGNLLGRRPNIEDVVRKVNEIIEYINNQNKEN